MTEADDAEMGMLMPFVTVASKGGPHDDGSYVAGAEMAQTDSELMVAKAVNAVPCPRYIRTDNVPQVDLIAMHHGFKADFAPWGEHPNEWTRVEFTNERGLTCVEAMDE